ncbi:hypothetical protein [Streptomyces cyaneus]|uniref:hypothetical protein n=1 Tax=Streptomyces cyaneus TaxID=1904 RepID=UPI000FF88390|nr:hypothetical protein [Streptomyces cyaneus]
MSLTDTLDDRALVLVLQEFTEELRGTAEPSAPLTESEARESLRALTDGADLEGVLGDEASATAAARRLLAVVLEDADTAPVAAPIAADPPVDDQLAVETAVTGIVVLAALVSWLQTKVEIKVHRKDGKTEFLFHLRKSAADPRTLRNVTETATQILTGNQPPQL